MLDGYGLHKLVWNAADERFGDIIVASPADAQGRGISLAIRQNGAAANLHIKFEMLDCNRALAHACV